MILDISLLAIALGVFIFSGLLFLALVDKKGDLDTGSFIRIALAFMLGLGLVTMQSFAYSIFSIPLNVPYIAVPWLVLGAWLLKQKGRGAFFPEVGRERIQGRPTGFVWLEVVFWIVIISQVVYAFYHALMLPIYAWDSWCIWFFKGKVLFVNRSVPSEFFLDEFVQKHQRPYYPLLVPFSVAWIYMSIGKISEQAARIIFPLQFASLLAIFYYGARKYSSRHLSFLFTTLIALTPIIMIHSGGLPERVGGLYAGDFVGYADLTLSIYLLAAASFFYLYIKNSANTFLILGASFLGMSVWTKNEGMTFALVTWAMILVYFLMDRKSVKPILIAFSLFAVFSVPWNVYKTYLDINNEFTPNMNIATILGNSSRILTSLKFVIHLLFKQNNLYNLSWYLYLLSIPVNWRGFLKRPVAFLNILLLGQIAAYFFIYLIIPYEILFVLRTSSDRLFLHLTPLALFIAFVNFEMFLYRPDRQDYLA